MFKFLKSTILIKIVMALTGLIIVGFLFAHAIGNLQYWISPDVYNTYAAFLQGLGEILWIVRIVLAVCLILHIISAVYLRIKNNAAKPIGYQVKNYAKAKLTSRTMLWTGLLVLSGAVFHLLHFTAGVVDIEGGYQQQELHPTNTFVAGGASPADACCGQCESSDKPCQHGHNPVATSAQSALNYANEQAAKEKPSDTKKVAVRGDVLGIHIVYRGVSISPKEYTQFTGHTIPASFLKAFVLDPNGEESAPPKGAAYDSIIKVQTEIEANLQAKDTDFVEKFINNRTDAPAVASTETGHACEGCANGVPCADCVVAGKYPQTGMNVYDEVHPNEIVKPRHDVYGMVTAEFSNHWVVISYIIFVILVGFHLNHAIQSALHTLGIEGPKFTPVMRVLSTLVSIALVLLFIILPLGILAKSLGLCCGIGGF